MPRTKLENWIALRSGVSHKVDNFPGRKLLNTNTLHKKCFNRHNTADAGTFSKTGQVLCDHPVE